MRAGGKWRFDPETLGVGGGGRGQEAGSCSSHLGSVPSAPPCVPCIRGSERGAGYCLKELAELPVLLDRGGETGGPRAKGPSGKREADSKERAGSGCPGPAPSSFPLLSYPGAGGGRMGEKQMECGSCGLALAGGSRTPWAWREKADELVQKAAQGTGCPHSAAGPPSLRSAWAQSPGHAGSGEAAGVWPWESGSNPVLLLAGDWKRSTVESLPKN